MSYSHKDFTGMNLTEHKIEPQTIRGSCFSQEVPDTEVFPPDMTGVHFFRCNLDNVLIPDGNTTEECSQRKFIFLDGQNWLIDENNLPVEVI